MKFNEIKIGDIVFIQLGDFFEENIVVDKDARFDLIWICSRGLKEVKQVTSEHLEKSKIETLTKSLEKLKEERQKSIEDYDLRILEVEKTIKRIAQEEDAKI